MRRYHIGVARAQKEVGVLCSADHGKSLCLDFFDFKNSLLASKVKLFKLLVIFLKKKKDALGKEVFKKNPPTPPSSGHILIQEISCVLQLCSSIVPK